MAGFDPKAYLAEDDAPASSEAFDPKAYLAEPEAQPGYFDQAAGVAMRGLGKVGQTLDSYGGAPTRAAIGALQDGGSFSKAAGAFKDQFGADPRSAPTGRDIARKLGVGEAPMADTPDSVLDAAGSAARMDPYSALAAGYMNAAKAIPRSAAAGMAVDVATDPLTYLPVGKAAEMVAGPAQRKLGGVAEKFAVKATGATGKAAAEFAPGAGRELLDRGIIRAGSSQAAVADRAANALDRSGKNIGDALTQLDAKGAGVSTADLVSELRQRAATLSRQPSKFSVADGLNRLADRMESAQGGISTDLFSHDATEAGVPEKFTLTEAENEKRGFDASTNFASSPAETSLVKEAGTVFRKAVENEATRMDPSMAAKFTANKADYKLLAPIAEASQKRALQLQQSPHGGLLDLVAIGEGGKLGAMLGGGPVGAAIGGSAGFVAKQLRPRYASVGAVAADALAKAPAGEIAAAGRYSARGVNSFNQNGGTQPMAPLDASPGQIGNSGAQPDRTPAKGPDAWAQSGLQKLGIQDQAMSARLLSDPKAKQLLIQASDLAPGSKAMKQIMDQIKARYSQ